jgi:hypothetical protein
VSKWTHRGIEINLLENGNFRCVLAAKPVVSNSLEGAKKRIDKEVDDPARFSPFKGYYTTGDKARLVEVIGTRMGRRRNFQSQLYFVCKSLHGRGEFEVAAIVRSTPETDAIAAELEKLKAKNEAAREAMDTAERELVERLDTSAERPK